MTPSTDLMPAASAPLADRMRYAAALADARLLPGPYRRSPADVLLAVELADALGIAPITALTSVHVIDGKPSMSAELMRALVLRAGHRLRIVESTSERCTLEVARRESPEESSRFTYTAADAERAGLLPGKPGSNWDRHPAAMLLARASSFACRATFPDVLAGVSYTPEELGAATDDAGAVVLGEVLDAPAAVEPGPEVLEAEVVHDDPAPDVVAGVHRPGTRPRPAAAPGVYASVRAALGLEGHPNDGPTEGQMRAANARLRAAGCRDEVHRGWAVAFLLDRPAYVESLRSLSRAEVSHLLDLLERDPARVAEVLAASAELGHPLDAAEEPAADLDAAEELEEPEAVPEELEPATAPVEAPEPAEATEPARKPRASRGGRARATDGPPPRPALSTDLEPTEPTS